MEKIFNKLLNNEIKPYQLEDIIFRDVYKNKPEKWSEANKQAALLRLKFLEEKTGKKFDNIKKLYVDTSNSEKKTTGIEQQIGSAATPLGMAGPIRINGEFAKGEFYLPIATNEAALIAGLNRGSKAINESGGIKTVISRDFMTRAPIIEVTDIEEGNKVCEDLNKKGELYTKMKNEVEKGSRVTKLIDIQPFQQGRFIHLRFCFQTGDAMGMNSATKYATIALETLFKKYPNINLRSLTGNMCTDKKASHINVLLGRGKSIQTEVIIPKIVISKIYKIQAEDIVKLNHIKNYQGSALSGTISGFNANAANTIAAMFVATSQDCAQITESSSCFTHAEVLKTGDLLFGVNLPCLEVATIGGGTSFGTAKECLEMLGCYGPGKTPGSNARKLAEIIAAAVTAQDLNLIAAEVHGYELAESHIKLARGDK